MPGLCQVTTRNAHLLRICLSTNAWLEIYESSKLQCILDRWAFNTLLSRD